MLFNNSLAQAFGAAERDAVDLKVMKLCTCAELTEPWILDFVVRYVVGY
jgi:hypothetical protein